MQEQSISQTETDLLYCIRSGDIERVERLFADGEVMELVFTPYDRQSFFRMALRAVELMTMAAVSTRGRPDEVDDAHARMRSFIADIEDSKSISGIVGVLRRHVLALTVSSRRFSNYNRTGYSPLVNRCINRILTRMPERITLTELSAQLHVTPKYLSSLFNRDTGTSITDFMQNIRIREAEYLLSHSDMNYPDISNFLCYGSQSYFNKVFKSKTGLTPREFRLRERSADENSHHHQ
ncbi:MAG: AraC family transcriptional regulator [Lachnospiraceae bacterium]|nr:AraC family transcriptional regulator [Lachnospiraceae bacterium]